MKSVKALHDNLLKEFKAHSGTGTSHTASNAYLGNTHFRYNISTPVCRSIAKRWVNENKEIEPELFSVFITRLIEGESHTEKGFAGLLLASMDRQRHFIKPEMVLNWLIHLEGWAEVDSVCYSTFTAKEIIGNFKAWEKLLISSSAHENMNVRRASMVFLCKPLMQEKDPGLSNLSFKIILRLANEKHILITKAVSWLMRAMVRNYRDELQDFILNNSQKLPAIALRETGNKLKTGRKNGK